MEYTLEYPDVAPERIDKYINNKVCEKLSNNLLIIMKMIYGWIKSEDRSK